MMRLLTSLILCAALASFASAAEPYWNQFRGHDGSGHSAETGLPDKLGEKENVKWKTPLDGKAWSSPVVWEKQVWLTNATEDGKQLFAVCLDLESGKIVHNITVFQIEKPMFCYPLNSYGTPTPAVEAGRVYVSYGSAGTACLDTKTGEIVWKRQDLKCDHFRGPASSPVIADDRILLEFDGFDVQYVVALDKKTGDTIWKQDRAFDYKTDNGDAKKAYGTPSVFTIKGQEMAICPAAVATEAFDPKSGKLLWTVRTEGMNASARPLLGEGLIFITNGMGKLVAVNPVGSGVTPAGGVVWETHKGVAKRASPLLVDGLLYMATDDGILTCVDAKTGDQFYSKRLTSTRPDGKSEFAASPVYADGKIYLVNMIGDAWVIKPGEKYEEISHGEFEDGCMATPAIAEKSLIVRTKKAVYRIAK
jgi:outer membrane protein assembly factor BamB